MTSTGDAPKLPASPPSAIVLDHVTVTVADLVPSQAFYDAALTPLGLSSAVEYLDPEDEDEVGIEAVGYAGADGRVVLWLVAGAVPTTGLHLAFHAADDGLVRAMHDRAVAAGARVHSPPRRWQLYRPGRYSATVVDPAGNLIEAVAG